MSAFIPKLNLHIKFTIILLTSFNCIAFDNNVDIRFVKGFDSDIKINNMRLKNYSVGQLSEDFLPNSFEHAICDENTNRTWWKCKSS